MNEEFQKPQGNSTMMVDLAMIALAALVLLLALIPGTRQYAIALGGGVPFAIGVVALLILIVDKMMKSSKNGDQNFSSLAPNDERAFIPHERFMQANTTRASVVGFGLAGVLFVVGMGVTMGFYSPCTNFCDRPPGSCKSDSQVAAWRASCESSCKNLENQGGLTLVKQRSVEDKAMDAVPASGTEYVTVLGACSFSGGQGQVCEEVVKRATSMGLWCPDDGK